jgi:hypothetical protein
VETLYKAYKGEVQFFLVYIREAHPSRSKDSADKSRVRKPPKGGLDISQHTSMDERVIAADKCMKKMEMTIPILLDEMDSRFLKAYGGSPAGTAVIGIDGKIAYWNPGAPRGCKPREAEKTLKKLLADGGGAVAAEWAKVKWPPKPASKKPASPAEGTESGKPGAGAKAKPAPEAEATAKAPK